jgi:hypothetical protein
MSGDLRATVQQNRNDCVAEYRTGRCLSGVSARRCVRHAEAAHISIRRTVQDFQEATKPGISNPSHAFPLHVVQKMAAYFCSAGLELDNIGCGLVPEHPHLVRSAHPPRGTYPLLELDQVFAVGLAIVSVSPVATGVPSIIDQFVSVGQQDFVH